MQSHKTNQRVFLWWLLAVVLLILITGKIFAIVEGYSWFDGIYWAIATLSTLGYGDISPHFFITKLITIILVILNVGMIASLGGLVVSRLIDKQIKKIFSMNTKKFHNHVIVCGFNALSEMVIDKLLKDKKEVVVIEKDPIKIEELKYKTGLEIVEGRAERPAILLKAGLEHAKEIIFVLSNDADSVIAVVESKKINAKARRIVRIKDGDNESVLREVGADVVICSNEIVAKEIFESSKYV